MSRGSAMDKVKAGMEDRPARAFPRVRQPRNRRQLRVVAVFTVVSLLFWLKISLGFGHGGLVA
jgi:hypothetical protein